MELILDGIAKYAKISAMEPRENRDFTAALAITVVVAATVLFYCAFLGGARDYDFAGCYAAGVIARQRGVAAVYDVSRQIEAQHAITGGKELFLYAYPPFHALIFSALARLPYTSAYLLWGLINLGLWAVFAAKMRPSAPYPQNSFRYLMLCFLFLPAWAALVLGQNSLMVLVLYFLAFRSLERGRDFEAGAWLGLGLVKYHLVLPFAAIFLLRGKWRVILAFGMVGAVLAGISFAVAGKTGISAYAHLLGEIANNSGDAKYESFSSGQLLPTVWGGTSALLARVVDAARIKIIAGLASAALLIFAAWNWRRSERSTTPDFRALYAASIAVALLAAPHLYSYDFSLMLLAILLMLNSKIAASARGWITAATILLYIPSYPYLFAHRISYFLILPMGIFAGVGFAGIQVGRGAERRV
jgi:hypothetical protein